MGRFKKSLIILAFAMVLFTVAGFFVLPPIIRSVLTDRMTEALQRPVSIASISINPYTLRLTIRGCRIMERSGSETFLSFDEFTTSFDLASLFRRALILRDMALLNPYCRIVRHRDHTYNFSPLLPPPDAAAKPKQQEESPFQFSLNNIQITGGRIDFVDHPVQKTHYITDLNISLPFISNTAYLAERFTHPSLSMKINGTPYSFAGKTKPFSDSLETDLDIDIKDLPIPYYLAYVPVETPFRIPSAFLDTRMSIRYIQQRDRKPTLRLSGTVTLRDLAVDDKNERPVIRLSRLEVAMNALEPLASSFHFSRIALTKPEVNISRDRRGEINLLSMAPRPPREASSPKVTQGKPVSPAVVKVDELIVSEGKISFRDAKPRQQVSFVLPRIDITVGRLSTVKGDEATVDLSLGVDGGGSVSAQGSFYLEPLTADLQLQIEKVNIRPFQGYITDLAAVIVAKGTLTAKGLIHFVGGDNKNGPSLKYTGNVLLADFDVIDQEQAERLVALKSLFISDFRFQNRPPMLSTRQIALTDFYTRLAIDETGTLNMRKIGAGVPPPEDGERGRKDKPTDNGETSGRPPSAEPFAIRIDTVTVQGGTIDFQDRYIKPNYSAHLTGIGGRVSGLSSREEKPAEVELRGRFNGHLPVEITGRLHPFPKDLFVDLKAIFRDMDLSPISPYSGKYIGYTIQKGKLSFDLKYLVVRKKLAAENKILIDQLTLGDPVESPDALKVPVSLAVALLKDRHGRIDLDIPLSGTTDDPEFSIFRLVIQVIVNLITKAVTTPFALLGSLVGAGEELSFVEFPYGSASLDDQARQKIAKLVTALQERPALKIEVAGFGDPERDLEGLKRHLLERKVKGKKLQDMVARGKEVGDVDSVRVDPGEYEKYLAEAYRMESFPKPRNILGLAKTLPAAEMEKLMLTHSGITAGDVKLLASRRATAVYNEILKSGKVSSERVFIVEPKTTAPEKKNNVKNSRVEFKLK